MNAHYSFSLVPSSFCKCLTYIKYPMFLAYLIGIAVNWSDTSLCIRPAYVANCIIFVAYATHVDRLLKFDINPFLLVILWMDELNIFIKSSQDPTCLATDGNFFPIFSQWFFRISLWIVTFLASIPLFLRLPCLRTLVERLINRQGLLLQNKDSQQENLDTLVPIVKYTKDLTKTSVESQESKDEPKPEACPICLEEFKEEENIRKVANCEHLFHSDCIQKWLNNHVNCPYCRGPILAKELSSQASSNYQPPRMRFNTISDIAGEIHVHVSSM